jgi:hypothetical protein
VFIMFNTATKSAVLAYFRHLYLVSACRRLRALNCKNEVDKKTTTRSVSSTASFSASLLVNTARNKSPFTIAVLFFWGKAEIFKQLLYSTADKKL